MTKPWMLDELADAAAGCGSVYGVYPCRRR
jgi:hypothetical protein